MVGAAGAQRVNVVDHPARTRASPLARGRARVLALERGTLAGTALGRRGGERQPETDREGSRNGSG